MLETFTILTTEPNDVVEGYHDRMPVMLEARMEGWLENKSEIPKYNGDLDVEHVVQFGAESVLNNKGLNDQNPG